MVDAIFGIHVRLSSSEVMPLPWVGLSAFLVQIAAELEGARRRDGAD
jgi:hypothetical protein